jgi:glycine/D-amino acid oxidase-like deaminating enzyme
MRFSTELPRTADVVVVGCGILGASTAYWLARAGARVVLVERAAPAHGATGRNGGFLTLGTAESYPHAIARLGHATARDVYTLTLENRALVRQVLAEEEIDCDYREPGTLALALSADQLAEMGHTVAALNADGFAAEKLDRTRVQELVAIPLGPDITGGVYVPQTGLLHSAQLVQGLVRAAERHGAISVQATVGRVPADGAGVAVETSRGVLRAGAVVLAANAWLDTLVPEVAGVIVPVRGQMLSYHALPPVFRTGMAAAVTATEEYWQQTPDGTIVLGGCRAVAPGKDVGFRDSTPTSEVQQALEGVLPGLFPRLSGLRVAGRWAGLMAFTPDYLPVADRVPGLDQAWVVGGFCGHGMPFGLRIGQLLAEAAIQNERPAALGPFRLGRPTLAGAKEAFNTETRRHGEGGPG